MRSDKKTRYVCVASLVRSYTSVNHSSGHYQCNPNGAKYLQGGLGWFEDHPLNLTGGDGDSLKATAIAASTQVWIHSMLMFTYLSNVYFSVGLNQESSGRTG